MTYIWWWFSVV